MKPRRTVTLEDLLDDIEAIHNLSGMTITHDGTCDIYDSDDIEFVDPELFERVVMEYEIVQYGKGRVGVRIFLK